MADKVQKLFVGSFINYLKNQIQYLSEDSQESVEVAMQCLQAAFDVKENETVPKEVTEPSTGDNAGTSSSLSSKEIDLFELFQSMYIERNPDNEQMAEAIKNEGNRLMKECKFHEALMQYSRAITFNPKNPIFYCNRAAAYIRLGEDEKAITDCKSALVYNPNYGKAFGRLGIAYSDLGKYNEAEQAYEKAIELEPDNQDYKNNLEMARSARNQAQLSSIPQLTEGLNAMLSSPAIRNLFNSAEIDLDQLQNMSQNPMIMNAISQLISGGFNPQQGGGGAGVNVRMGGSQIPPMSNDLMQLFQSFATQLANANPNANPNSNNQNNQQPPPSV